MELDKVKYFLGKFNFLQFPLPVGNQAREVGGLISSRLVELEKVKFNRVQFPFPVGNQAKSDHQKLREVGGLISSRLVDWEKVKHVLGKFIFSNSPVGNQAKSGQQKFREVGDWWNWKSQSVHFHQSAGNKVKHVGPKISARPPRPSQKSVLEIITHCILSSWQLATILSRKRGPATSR